MSRKKAEWHGCRECGCKHNGECDEQLAAKDAEIEALKSKTPHTSCWAEIETLKARAEKAEREAHDALINLDESEECSAELFELCCDVLDGKPNAEKARNDLREHVEHVRKCRRGSCAVAIRGSQKARADRLAEALREISRNIAENLPMTGLDAHINAIAAAALEEEKNG